MLFLHTLQLKIFDIQYIRIRQPYDTNAEVLLFSPLTISCLKWTEPHKFHQLSQLMKCRGFPSPKLKMEIPLNYDCGRSCRLIFTALVISLILYLLLWALYFSGQCLWLFYSKGTWKTPSLLTHFVYKVCQTSQLMDTFL